MTFPHPSPPRFVASGRDRVVAAVLRHRVEVGSEGIRWRTVELPWDRVKAVRILVRSTTKPLAVAVAQRRVRTRTRLTLEVSLREPDAAEADLPLLRSRRILGASEGYTHDFPIGPGASLTGAGPAHAEPGVQSVLAQVAAPEVQAVLAQVAAPIYQGVARQTETKGRA